MAYDHNSQIAVSLWILAFYVVVTPIFSWFHLPRFSSTLRSVVRILVTRCMEYNLDCDYFQEKLNPEYTPLYNVSESSRRRRQTQLLFPTSIHPIDIQGAPSGMHFYFREFDSVENRVVSEEIQVSELEYYLASKQLLSMARGCWLFLFMINVIVSGWLLHCIAGMRSPDTYDSGDTHCCKFSTTGVLTHVNVMVPTILPFVAILSIHGTLNFFFRRFMMDMTRDSAFEGHNFQPGSQAFTIYSILSILPYAAYFVAFVQIPCHHWYPASNDPSVSLALSQLQGIESGSNVIETAPEAQSNLLRYK